MTLNLPGAVPVGATQPTLEETLRLAEEIICQHQRDGLDRMAVHPMDEADARIDPSDVLCLFRVTELVYARDEGNLEGLSTVLTALHACGAACVLLLQCRDGHSDLYLGAVNKRHVETPYYRNTIRDILRSGIGGNMPGTEMQEVLTRAEIGEKLQDCLNSGFDSQCITSVSCAASPIEDVTKSLRGMETLLSAIGRRNFSLLILADPVSQEELKQIRQGYEDLGSQLSAFEHTSISRQEGTSSSVSAGYSNSISTSLSRSLSLTQGRTITTGVSRSHSDRDMSGGKALLAAGSMIAGVNLLPSILMAKTVSDSESRSENDSRTQSMQAGTQEGKTQQETSGTASGTSSSVTVQSSAKDYRVQELVSRVGSYLGWLRRCENFGLFNCCAYILSCSASVNLMVASQYQALMQGDGEMPQPVSINTWTEQNDAERVREYLMKLRHPLFRQSALDSLLSPAMLISGRELARQMALPRRSVVGVSVMQYASFGRDVVRKTPLATGAVARVGAITHMGQANPDQPVLLDVQSLASHTFVAGTNGSGKSNTVFCLLEQLREAGVPFMVIEPAKGEYKNVFGHDADVAVYGTNPRLTPLMHINPFFFHESVSVREHIEKLIEVFSASWPMYAAMPSVLKSSIENAYVACGWNLRTSECEGAVIFPTVRDVIREFDVKMASTAFSEEVRGNYVGALSTRLESLSTGIFEEIFSGEDMGDEALFDRSVIIDISRVGSSETKAMLMGILLIRLQEYRMRNEAMNRRLSHVTVLEEAHHLLRRTSAAQSEDMGNMAGKSVEMLSSAIAEMRSFGEGFIIVDQSPGLLDASVIRNTNTKMILRLPDGGDRELVSTTMGLTEQQANEISRLKTGVCAIYQKDWLEAVLCQVDRAWHREKKYVHERTESSFGSRHAFIRELLGEPSPDFRAHMLQSALSGNTKRALLDELPDLPRPLVIQAVNELCSPQLRFPADMAGDPRLWLNRMLAANGLTELFTPADAVCVIREQVNLLAQKDKRWGQVSAWLDGLVSDARLPALRGKALALLLGAASEIPAEAALEAWRSTLEEGAAPDRQLAQLLQKYRQTGKIRQQGEISPYSAILWAMTRADAPWKTAWPHLQGAKVEAWHTAMTRAVQEHIVCDPATCVGILGLLLQHRGKDPAVHAFYYKWYTWAAGAVRSSDHG